MEVEAVDESSKRAVAAYIRHVREGKAARNQQEQSLVGKTFTAQRSFGPASCALDNAVAEAKRADDNQAWLWSTGPAGGNGQDPGRPSEQDLSSLMDLQ